MPQIDPSVPQPVLTITEKAPTRAFSWLKADTTAFTFKTLTDFYGFSTPVTHTQVLIEIKFEAPETL